jgi:hypothetical protein
MPKQQRRKPPKRPTPRPKIDDDLAELATMLAEHRLDNNAAGWFTMPWRDGWNAAKLAYECHLADGGDVDTFVHGWVMQRAPTAAMYWTCAELMQSGGSPLFMAALRCIQVKIATSDGGGHVYNYILQPIFERYTQLDKFEQLVADSRFVDSVGGLNSFSPRTERLRRAFYIAWRRGLYAAAYALPRVIP